MAGMLGNNRREDGMLGGRSHLLKATRRLGRTMRTEAKLFLARPSRRAARFWKPIAVAVVGIALIGVVAWFALAHIFGDDIAASRENSHFNHRARILPLGAQRKWDRAALRPCSWLYLELNAGDGRHTRAFFTNGNAILEEILRASQASMRGFCAVVTEPDPQYQPALEDVRAEKGSKARAFDVFSGIVAGNSNGTENIRLKAAGHSAVIGEQDVAAVRSVDLVSTVKALTYPWEKSGYEVGDGMTIATGNRQNGTVVLRINARDMREAFWYLDMLDTSNVLCERVDRLMLNFQPMKFDPERHYLTDRTVERDIDAMFDRPNDKRYDPAHGWRGILDAANYIQDRPECRTMVHLIDEQGKSVFPEVISERSVFYAILAGQPTFDERIGAQTASWMSGVPKDRVAIYTNVQRSGEQLDAAQGRDVITTAPNKPELEQQLHMMQSWSHLVRVRESWDRYMKKDESIQWLMLVDDDTFVFPGALREYLTSFDPRVLGWGGSGEQARIDNGDAGQFATWLRDLNTKHGGKHCYLPNEDIPKRYQGRKITYGTSKVMNGRRVAHVVSHMCSDAFCRRGCPAVPQGATIFLSRALVQQLRPHIEECEQSTSKLCKNCGSQRLYMCVNKRVHDARTYMTRGVCRATWRLEHRANWPFAVTYHGFQKYQRISSSTGTITGDMAELWQLGKSIEVSRNMGKRSSYLVPMQRVADLIGCRGQGTYKDGKCISQDGVELDPHDGTEKIDVPGERASDRMGSA